MFPAIWWEYIEPLAVDGRFEKEKSWSHQKSKKRWQNAPIGVNCLFQYRMFRLNPGNPNPSFVFPIGKGIEAGYRLRSRVEIRRSDDQFQKD
jgi:hypothetical protein